MIKKVIPFNKLQSLGNTVIVYVTGFSYPFTTIACAYNFVIPCCLADDAFSHIKRNVLG